jgi:hypothetical protein
LYLRSTGSFWILNPPLVVDSVNLVNVAGKSQQSLKYQRREGKLWIELPLTKQPGEDLRVRIAMVASLALRRVRPGLAASPGRKQRAVNIGSQ